MTNPDDDAVHSRGPGDEGAPFRTVASRDVYANAWITVREDDVEYANGHRGIYGVVTTGPCVGVLPFVAPDRVVLVRQWRYVTGRPTWEMPTGGAHADESLEAAAQRELAEETGWRAGRLERIGTFVSSKSVLDESPVLFVASQLGPAAAAASDPTEDIEVAELDFDTVVHMVVRGEIVDAMTVIAVLLTERARAHTAATVWPPTNGAERQR